VERVCADRLDKPRLSASIIYVQRDVIVTRHRLSTDPDTAETSIKSALVLIAIRNG
jgi:hypothetical protein